MAAALGFCGTVLYGLWSARDRPEAAQTSGRVSLTAASQAHPSRPAESLPFAAPAAAADTEPERISIAGKPLACHPLFASEISKQRQQLENLPSWLSIPEGQKDALAELAAITQAEMELNESTEEGREFKRQWDALKREAPARVERLLGYPASLLWEEYQETVLPRSQLAAVNTQVPHQRLSENQTRSLATALLQASTQAEQESQVRHGIMSDGPTLKNLEIRKQIIRRSRALQQQVAVAQLSPEQMKVFGEKLRLQQVKEEIRLAQQKIRLEAEASLLQLGATEPSQSRRESQR